jgi:hypothetical protein
MIVCSECGGESSVKDSRPASGTIRRRRRCDRCGSSWTTFEVDRDTILKLRIASKMYASLIEERKRVEKFTEVMSEFSDLEAMASSGRGRKKKRQLKSRIEVVPH